jgi:hypothetical protein
LAFITRLSTLFGRHTIFNVKEVGTLHVVAKFYTH